ncbi:MAG: DNA gyrase subunit B [Christensenellaceae bacterium]|jgi:DNA gyrase subunit B|nr:DNA gyrase subunit B [Christensenellaceae bacterium]
MANEKQHYNVNDLTLLKGLDAVRKRPGMYIGTTGSKGMHHLLWEIVDNGIDEVANGFGNRLTVTIHTDNSVTVEDNGRGIPVGIHKDLGISGVEMVFTELHAGGKFGDSNYAFSGGLHGVGASVVNALSDWCVVTVWKDGKEYYIRFSPHLRDDDNELHWGIADEPLKMVGKTDKTGTKVHFLPDKTMFKDVKFDNETISKRLKELAFLNKGIEIQFIDERVDKDDAETPRELVFKYDGGVADFVAYLNESKDPLYQKPFIIEGATDKMPITFAIQHTDGFTESIFSYVNNIPTSEGGTHETGFKSAITRAFNQIGRNFGYYKDKDQGLMGEDYREGMTAVLSIKMKEVQFEGQTKTKLGNPEAKIEVETFTYNNLCEYFKDADKKADKKLLLETVINKAKAAARVREAARKAKDIARQKNSIDGSVLIGKLSSCSGRRPELNEVFIVEGDSAGGTAKQGRDRSIQAILPLRGKPLNAEKKRIDQVLENEEFRTLIGALGTGIGEDFNLDNLKYHKVIILADADQDGGHIRSILLTFFFRYMKELITEGHIYTGMPPLYRVFRKDFSRYCYDENELKEVTKKEKGTIQRYKGLGEMNADQLWDTTMNPKTRKLCRITLDDAAEAERLITTLMGDDIESRREYISKHANFNKIDDLAVKTVKSKLALGGAK